MNKSVNKIFISMIIALMLITNMMFSDINSDVAAASGFTVIHSSGFEADEPDIWNTIRNSDGYSHGFDEDLFRSGTRSYKFTNVSQLSDDPNYQAAIANNKLGTPFVEVEGGKEYLISFWYYTEDYVKTNSTLGARISVENYSTATNSHSAQVHYTLPEGTTNEWQKHEFVFTTAENADRMRINLSFRTATGTVWFDDLTVSTEANATQHDFYSMEVVSVEANQVTLNLLDINYEHLDSVQFSNESSEIQHQVEAPNTSLGVGGLSEGYRSILPGGHIKTTLEVDPNKQNYFTVKLWGSDVDEDRGTLFLDLPEYGVFLRPYYLSEQPELDYMNEFPMHAGVFYYVTYIIPRYATMGKTSIDFKLYATGRQNAYAPIDERPQPQTKPSRGIYQAYTHLDPFFIPTGETLGSSKNINEHQVAVYPSDQSQADYLATQAITAIDNIISYQKYGQEYEDAIVNGDFPEKALGAITLFHAGSWEGTEEDWDQHMHHRTVGSNATSLNSTAMLARAYHGQWAGDYYQDEELIDRVARSLDYYTRAQGSIGGFLGSASHPWPGGPDRKAEGGTLEGFGIMGIAEALILMYDEMDALALLDELIDHDNDPTTAKITRRAAYTSMFQKVLTFLTRDPGRIANQEIANMYAMFLSNEALRKLAPHEAWSDAQVYEFLFPAIGLAKNEHTGARRPYTMSPKGLGMEGNSYDDRGGYDGNYGPHSVKYVSYLGRAADDLIIKNRAIDLIEAMSHYFNLAHDAAGQTALIQEEVVSWRINSAPGREKYYPNAYFALEHHVPAALRQLHLFIQHGAIFSDYNFETTDAHYLARLDEALYLMEGVEQAQVKNLVNHDPYVQALIDSFYREGPDVAVLNTTSLNQHKPQHVILPMENAAPDFAWADEVASTVVIKHQDERLYMTLNWRGQVQANNLARIHHKSDLINRVVNMTMASPYGFEQLYVARYGDYFIAMNSSFDETYHINFTGDYTEGLELVTKGQVDLTEAYTLPSQTTAIIYLGEPEEPVLSELDTDTLATKIADAQTITNSDGRYTFGSFTALQSAISIAEAVLEAVDENSTQQMIDDAVDALQIAIEALVLADTGPSPTLPTAPVEPPVKPETPKNKVVADDEMIDTDHSEVMITLPEHSEDMSGVIAEVPADILQGLAESGKPLVIQSGDVVLTIPAAVIADAAASSPSNLSIHIILASDVRVPGGDGVSNVYDLTITTERDGQTTTISTFNEALTVQVPVADSDVQDPRKVAGYRINGNSLEYVGGKYEDGKLIFRTHSLSLYVAVEKNITFADIATHWAKDEIEVLASRTITNGKGLDRFAPEEQLTRAEFAVLIARALNLPTKAHEGIFQDVTTKLDWAHAEIESAYRAGIIHGRNATTFDPSANITREELATMVMRAIAYMDAALLDELIEPPAFNDAAEISSFAREAATHAQALGIIHGKTGHIFDPKGTAKRAEAVTMLYRAMNTWKGLQTLD